MFRATTPTHIFTLPFETDLLKEVQITYQQGHKTILQKTKGDCALTKTALQLTLTQEETLLFSDAGMVSIQLRLITTEGKAMASDIQEIEVKKCLDEEVLE